ncbi:hypothetical protein [Vibrio phage BONAISHI]|nr:hypothetical protein [Vibrio phage BONAISHI]
MKTDFIDVPTVTGPRDISLKIIRGAKTLMTFGTKDLWAFDRKGNFFIPPSDHLFKFKAKHYATLTMVSAATLKVRVDKMLAANSAQIMSVESQGEQWSASYIAKEQAIVFTCLNSELPTFYTKMTGDKSLSMGFQREAGITFPVFFKVHVDEWKIIAKHIQEFADQGTFFNNAPESSSE